MALRQVRSVAELTRDSRVRMDGVWAVMPAPGRGEPLLEGGSLIAGIADGRVWVEAPDPPPPPRRWTRARTVLDAAGGVWDRQADGSWLSLRSGAASATGDVQALGPIIPLVDAAGRPVPDSDREAALAEQGTE